VWGYSEPLPTSARPSNTVFNWWKIAWEFVLTWRRALRLRSLHSESNHREMGRLRILAWWVGGPFQKARHGWFLDAKDVGRRWGLHGIWVNNSWDAELCRLEFAPHKTSKRWYNCLNIIVGAWSVSTRRSAIYYVIALVRTSGVCALNHGSVLDRTLGCGL